MKVIIDGVEYVPKVEVKELTDKSLKECLEVLTSMRCFNQQHKMKAHAWEAINALSPDLAKLDEKEAYDFIHGAEE
jgi:chorismate mutase